MPAGGRAAPEAVVPKADLTITSELDFAGVGAVGKFNGNLAAILLLKQLETEGRCATAAEQSILARYVGGGGLPTRLHDLSALLGSLDARSRDFR